MLANAEPFLKESELLLQTAFSILEQVRSQKSSLKKSLAASVKSLKIKAGAQDIKRLQLVKEDMAKASHVLPENLHAVTTDSLTQPQIEMAF